MRIFLLYTALAFLFSAAAPAATDERSLVQQQRLQKREIHDTLIEGLLTLADMRILERPGRHHPFYDSCGTGDGCLSIFPFEDPRTLLGVPTPLFWPHIKNYPGEWSSSIHALTRFIKTGDGQAPITIPDANMFVNASILYPLAFVTEADFGPLRSMTKDALASIRHYKRGGAYSFWRQHPSTVQGYQVIGPLNIPAKILDVMALVIKDGTTVPDGHSPAMRPGWPKAILDKQINPVGMEAFFNIPNDADDTALAMIAFRLFHADADSEAEGEPEDLNDLQQRLMAFRDLNRAHEDGRDGWKGQNSGAFLTWLKDETLPLKDAFRPSDGTMPFGVNNVDCVVNANVAFALGLTGAGDQEAVANTLDALNRAIDLESWPYCGLYYPHKMMLPYTLTRAYRDGGLHHPGMVRTLGRIAIRLIADQKETGIRNQRHQGAFSGGVDATYALSTALAVNSLLNIGRAIPKDLGILDEYQRAIDDGIAYLIKEKSRIPVRYPEALGGLYRHGAQAAVWTPGLFFSASVQQAAQWRSEPYTAAIVVEAFAKYLLAWEHGNESILAHQPLMLSNGELRLND